MNVEIIIQEGIEQDIAELLEKSDTMEKASAFLCHYLQKKISEGVLDLYDYTLTDKKTLGIWVYIEYTFAWNVNNTIMLIIGPNKSNNSAYNRAMGVI
jgi:hypothetical protein